MMQLNSKVFTVWWFNCFLLFSWCRCCFTLSCCSSFDVPLFFNQVSILLHLTQSLSGFPTDRPVIVEIPHFGSMRGQERELILLRSDNGETWKEHQYDWKTRDLQELLAGMDEGMSLS